ncbi:zona pellucida sperm-binding protein 4 [Amia ocellicauda]|uniref:zona pellucida sperm-binding protein 4 n=1 Tax=Amia ocellicauda TaxID=2972642 RepID=UPI00346493C9
MTLEREDMEEPVEEDGSEEVEREKLEQLDPPEHVKLVEDEEEHSLPDDYDNMSFYQKDSSVPPNLEKGGRLYAALTLRYYDLILKTTQLTTVSCLLTATLSQPQLPKGLSISCNCSKALVPVLQMPKSCGYSLVKGQGLLLPILASPQTLCFLSGSPLNSCFPFLPSFALSGAAVHHLDCVTAARERVEIQVSSPYHKQQPWQGWHLPKSQQVSCGPKSVLATACLASGCCVDPETAHCYYPLAECTSDKHSVLAIHRTLTIPAVDPSSLVIAGNKSCTPVICTSDFVVFKFPLTGCGTHAFVVGKTTIYLAEVTALAQHNSLNYGVITRDNHFRLLIECQYAEDNVMSTGYLVKSPNLPSIILSPGVFGVQLRIATDYTYSRFYPQYHRPLWLLLGHPMYLEVRLLSSPDPNFLLLVHYCVAYPHSARAVCVLLVEGCPNPLDYGHISTLHVNNQLPLPRQHCRYHITTSSWITRCMHTWMRR